MRLIGNIINATTITNNAKPIDWIYAVISISPLLPFFIFIPRLMKKIWIEIDWTWVKMYDKQRHTELKHAMFTLFSGGCEIV